MPPRKKQRTRTSPTLVASPFGALPSSASASDEDEEIHSGPASESEGLTIGLAASKSSTTRQAGTGIRIASPPRVETDGPAEGLLPNSLDALPSHLLARALPALKRNILRSLFDASAQATAAAHGSTILSDEMQAAREACLGQQKQWDELSGMLSNTITHGEGNSALILGAPGCGKKTLLRSALSTLPSSKYHHVQLDGTVQTTDALAMKELARQLVSKGAIALTEEQKELLELDATGRMGEETGDKDGEAQSDDRDEPTRQVDPNGGDEENLKEAMAGAILSSISTISRTILSLLSTPALDSAGSVTSCKSLIISLSSFDLFTSRPRQALLYVLLDAVQAGSYAPGLCIIGLTRRLDTTDLLEKRVRSRFAGRTIHLYPLAWEGWRQLTKRTLMSGLSDASPATLKHAWTEQVEALLGDQLFARLLQGLHELGTDVRQLYRILSIPIAGLSASKPQLDTQAFLTAAHSQRDDSTSQVLDDLSTAEFALLVASKHLQRLDRQVFNFEMCFKILRDWAQRCRRERQGVGAASLEPSGEAERTLELDGAASPRTRRRIGDNESDKLLVNREKMLMAFQSLLTAEIFLPDAMFSSMSLLQGPQSGAASLTGRSKSSLSGGSVRLEYLKVRCAVDAVSIADAARRSTRRVPLDTALVLWATGSGTIA
ncbi:Origin recognition complex, subunit 4 [Ceraceosorus bombacis]|uniref:Origin recognition complex, subunit 4 n=1 Tax=Ceraceosorus bombacis TaxID=401625 RepID=A0A0P1BNA1_9BASI|nr:Origin recognition complex, subunit 4 [Ceraceosorus bombacis]